MCTKYALSSRGNSFGQRLDCFMWQKLFYFRYLVKISIGLGSLLLASGWPFQHTVKEGSDNVASKIRYAYCYACPKCSKSFSNINASAQLTRPQGPIWCLKFLLGLISRLYEAKVFSVMLPSALAGPNGSRSSLHPTQVRTTFRITFSITHGKGRKGLMTTGRFLCTCARGMH